MHELTEREIAYERYKESKRQLTSCSKFGPTELPPLQAGEQRVLFTKPELFDFIRSGVMDRLFEDHDLIVRFTFDARYAIDVVMKSTQGGSVGSSRAVGSRH